MSQSESLTRPIIGIEDRTAQEVFDIMCDRIAAWNRRPSTADRGGAVEPSEAEVEAAIVAEADAINKTHGDPGHAVQWPDDFTPDEQHCRREGMRAGLKAAARIRSALATTAGEAKWFAASVPPSIPVGTQRSFIVAVRRAHSGKVYSFPAIYLNGYQLVYETGECPKGNGCEGNGCDDGCPTTGWYSDSSEGEYDHNYAKLALAPGDEFLAWSPIQQFDPDRVALVTDKG